MTTRYQDRPSDARHGWVIIRKSGDGARINGPAEKKFMELALSFMPDAQDHCIVPATYEDTCNRGQIRIPKGRRFDWEAYEGHGDEE